MKGLIGTRERFLRLAGALGLATLMVGLLLFTDLLAPARDAEAQGSPAPASVSSWATTETMSTTFTYQGRLEDGDGPVTGTCDLRFELYAAGSGGSPLATLDRNSEPVTDGYFDVPLDFGADAFAGERRWLGIQVKCGSETGYTDLGRQELTAAPYALHAADAWSLTGNSGTAPGTHFLGTTDDVSLNLMVNGARALRLEPTSGTPNVIGGSSSNRVDDPGAVGGTIGGGGASAEPNVIEEGDYATIGGGRDNGARGHNATIGGGRDNYAMGHGATIGGGYSNMTRYNYATVGGGYDNTGDADYATVAGGHSNDADGDYAAIPGGYGNDADGDYSFAAGRQAQAVHNGTFVWADSTAADLVSTGVDQFLVRATGGVDFTTGGAPFQINGRPVYQPAHVIVVAQSGGDYRSIQAAIDAITGAAVDNPYLVWVAPGVYSETVTMKPHVHLQGAGQGATVVSSTVSSGWPITRATLVLTRNTSLRDLTVNNTGAVSQSVALLARDGTTQTLVADVMARAQGEGPDNFAIFLTGSGTGVTLRGVTSLSENGADSNYGLYNYGSAQVALDGGTFTGRGGNSARGIYHMDTDGGATLEAESITALGEDAVDYNIGLICQFGAKTTLHGGTFTARGGTNAWGICNWSSDSRLKAMNVTALGENATNSYGLVNYYGAEAMLQGGSFTAQGGANAYGLNNWGSGSTLESRNVAAFGADYGLYQDNGTARVGVSQLVNGAYHAGGTLTCFQVYDETYAAYSCP